MGPRGHFYSYMYHVIDVGTGVVLRVELLVHRGLCPIFVRDVGSPDIHECFCELTGSQRTPRIWGVTDEVKAIITLRSGKQVKQPMPKPLEEAKEEKNEEVERIWIKEDMMKKSMPLPFPQALKEKKKVKNQNEILEVLR